MRETKEKEIIKKEKVVVKIICDECGKEIEGHYINIAEHETPYFGEGEDWDDKDYCSAECFSKHVLEKYKDFKKPYFGGIFSIWENYFDKEKSDKS